MDALGTRAPAAHTACSGWNERDPSICTGLCSPLYFSLPSDIKAQNRNFYECKSDCLGWLNPVRASPTPLVLIPSLSGPCATKQIYCHTCSVKSLKLIQVSKHNFPAVKFLLHILPSSSIIVLRCTLYIYQCITVW